jgi:hypothetical protein
MCKNAIIVVSTPKTSKRDEKAYVQTVRNEILSSQRSKGGKEFKVEVNFVDHNGHIDYYSKKGSHIQRVVFDLRGHRSEEKIIKNIKRGLEKVNKAENPIFMRFDSGQDLHGCKSISNMKHATYDFGM